MAKGPDWLVEITNKIADNTRINRELVQAICAVESSWNRYAVRFEPTWKYVTQADAWASKLNITTQTETQLQSMSWGLMQIMGSVARELGFTDYIHRLSDPLLGVNYGCLKLRKLYERYGEANESDIIAGYNAGSALKEKTGMYFNQQYVDKVSRELSALRQLK